MTAMLDTTQAVVEFLEAALTEHGNGSYVEYADSYGEPGYADPTGDTPLIVLGSFWCQCGDPNLTDPRNGRPIDGALHDRLSTHYPHVLERLEANGVEFVWSDEWMTTPDGYPVKAWRTEPDSYGWQPSVMLVDGEWLTPDDGLDAWLEWAVNDSTRCLPSVVWSPSDLEAAGWTRYDAEDRYDGSYASGWYPGQNDTPEAVTEAVRRVHGGEDRTHVVFLLDSTGQFDLHFSVWTRPADYAEYTNYANPYVITT